MIRLFVVCLLVTLVGIAPTCDESPRAAPKSAGWPSFEATYREEVGESFLVFDLEFSRPDLWTTIVRDSSSPSEIGSSIAYSDGVVRHYDSRQRIVREEVLAKVLPPMADWGHPIASAEELLAMDQGWEKSSDDTVVLVRSFEYDCGSTKGDSSCTEFKKFVRDDYGIPTSFERRVNGEIVRRAIRLDFELIGPN